MIGKEIERTRFTAIGRKRKGLPHLEDEIGSRGSEARDQVFIDYKLQHVTQGN